MGRTNHTDFDDGENYYKLHGRGLWVPARAEHRPRRDYLAWHNENRFRGSLPDQSGSAFGRRVPF